MAMTLEEAVDILQGDVLSYPEWTRDEAIRVAEENGRDDLVNYAHALIEAHERENNLTGNEVDEYSNNNADLNNEVTTYHYSTFINHRDNEDIAGILNRTDVIDTDGKTVLSEGKKDNYLNLLFENAKLQAEIHLTGDKEFAEKSDSEKKQTFRDEVKTIFLTDFARAAVASKMDKPTSKEQKIDSAEYKAYIDRQYKKAQEAFQNIIDGGKRITVKADSILSAVADTAVKAENYVRSLKDKAMAAAERELKEKWNHLATKFQIKKNRLEEQARLLSDNRYEIIKNVKNSMKDNAWKIGTNIAAGVGLGVGLGVAAGPALIAYGAYHTAGSWVWPVVKEYRKINRTRREDGQEKLGFKKALKEAWKTTTTGKNKKKYLIGASVNSALGVALMGWGANAFGSLHEVTATALSTAATKTTVRAAKAGVATTAQLIDAAVSKEKSTAYAALAGGAISFLMIGDGLNANAANASVKENLDSIADLTPAKPGVEAAVTDSIAAPQPQVETATENVIETTSENASTDVIAAAENVAEADIDDDVEFPREYSSEMGISERQYNILVSTTEGTLKSATGEEVTLDNAYANLDDEAMAHFPGKTREEVMFKFNRLYAFMRKAYETGSGSLRETPSGAEFLEQKFSSMNLNLDDDKMRELVSFAETNTYASKKTIADGLKEIFPEGIDKRNATSIMIAIHSNQRFYQNAEEMEALIKLLGCGDKITAEQGQAINALLDRSDTILSNGNSNAQLTGLNLSKGCEDDDGEWRRTAAPKVVAAPEPAPEPEPASEPERISPITTVSVPTPTAQIDIPMAQGPEKLEINVPVVAEPEPEPEPTPEPEPEQKKMKVRKMTGEQISDLSTGHAEKQEIVSESKAESLMRKHYPNGRQGR